MKHLSVFSIVAFCLFQTLASANSTNAVPSPKPSPLDAYQALTFTAPHQTNALLRYRFSAPPKVEPGQRYPLLVCLHGAGERGTNNTSQVGHFLPLLKAVQAATPCFVVIPQVPPSQLWATYGWSTKTETMNGSPTPMLQLTKQLIDSLVAGGAVDTDRIYITGLSMGGYGTWEAIQRWPDFFAAAIPICGGGDPALANTLTTLPLWAWHGEVDTVIEVNKTRRMIDAINAAGGHPKATYIAKCGHGSWGPAYKEAALSTWLLAQRRPSKPSGK